MRGGNDGAKGIEGRTAQEDVIGCWCVDNEEADWDVFSLGSLLKNGVEVNVARVDTCSPEKPYIGSSYGTMAVSGS